MSEEAGDKESQAEAMMLELEALMSDVDEVQRKIDGGNESEMSVENQADPQPAATPQPAAATQPNPEAIFRELEGLTSMMDSVTRSLMSDKEGGGGGGSGSGSGSGGGNETDEATPPSAPLNPDSSLSSFLEAFEGVVGGGPVNVSLQSRIEGTTPALAEVFAPTNIELTTPPASEPAPVAAPVTATEAAPGYARSTLEATPPSTSEAAPVAATEEAPEDATSTSEASPPPATEDATSTLEATPPPAPEAATPGTIEDSDEKTVSMATSSFPATEATATTSLDSQTHNESSELKIEEREFSQRTNQDMATAAMLLAVENSVESSSSEIPKESKENNKESDFSGVNQKSSVVHPRTDKTESASTDKTENVGKKISPTSTPPAKAVAKAAKKSKKAAASHGAALAPETPAVVKETPDAVLKALQNYSTPEAKLRELSTRHAAAVNQSRELEAQTRLEQRRTLATLKEKEILSAEHQKNILAKSKLESLCRELQKHSKMVKDESMKRAEIEEAKRKEVADSFQSTIEEVTNRMQDNSERNNALREQNEELATKMNGLVLQYEKREAQTEKMIKHKELETQLVQAKLDKAEAEKKAILERGNKERELLVAQAMEAVKKTQVLEQNEKHLRAQIELYTEKYDEFQSTLSKSNTVFNNFKSEMAQMTKKIKKLEKEIQMWRGKWETSNTQLEKVTKEKEKSEAELKEAKGKTNKLEKLCRALQQERHSLSNEMSKLSVGKDSLENNAE